MSALQSVQYLLIYFFPLCEFIFVSSQHEYCFHIEISSLHLLLLTMTEDFTVRSEGRFNGGSYKIHRNGSSACLSVTLIDEASLCIDPDVVVAKNGQIVFKRIFQFKFRKLLNNEPFVEHFLIGPGEALLTPPVW